MPRTQFEDTFSALMLIIWIIRKKRERRSLASPNKKVVFQFSGKVSYRNCRAISLTPITGQVEWLTIKHVACKHLEHKLVASRGSHGLTENQFSSVQLLSRVRLCDPMNHSTPGLPVHHQLPEFTHTHVHQVGDAIQPSHPLSAPSPPTPNPSQHQSFPMSQLFAWGGQSIGFQL